MALDLAQIKAEMAMVDAMLAEAADDPALLEAREGLQTLHAAAEAELVAAKKRLLDLFCTDVQSNDDNASGGKVGDDEREEDGNDSVAESEMEFHENMPCRVQYRHEWGHVEVWQHEIKLFTAVAQCTHPLARRELRHVRRAHTQCLPFPFQFTHRFIPRVPSR